MKPPVETIRISRQGREQLVKLKRNTGIPHWNILCRWALCASLREQTPPQETSERLDGGVEMAWKVLVGDHGDVYAAIVLERASRDGFDVTAEGAGRCIRAHIHRGLTYLASGNETRSLADFADRWVAG